MPTNGYASILLGNGDGSLLAAGQYSAGASSSPTSILAAHFNSDTFSDLAAVDANGDTVSILLNEGNWPIKTWIGPASGGNWSTSANWSPSGVPAASDLVTISGKSINLSASAVVSGLTLIGGASLTVAANGNGVLRAGTLSISGDSKLDLKDNDLILDYTAASPIGSWNGTSYTGVTGLIQSGGNGGAGNGSGIVTSMSSVGDGTTRALVLAEAAAVVDFGSGATAMWNGVTVDKTTVLVKYTYAGDIDLSGELNGDDYFWIDSNILHSGVVFGYANGDINLDGEINGDDYFWLDSNIVSAGMLGPI
jgi:hypothetical protein